MSNPMNRTTNTTKRHKRGQHVPLKAYHHLKLKLRQLFCLHGDYAYLEITTQRKPEFGKTISFAKGCKKCGWINMAHPCYGMPRTLRNSYDRTYLRITDKHDVLLVDVAARKKKRKQYRKFDKENGTNWEATL